MRSSFHQASDSTMQPGPEGRVWPPVTPSFPGWALYPGLCPETCSLEAFLPLHFPFLANARESLLPERFFPGTRCVRR